MRIRTRLVAIAGLLLASSFMVGSANPVSAASGRGLNLTVWSMTSTQMDNIIFDSWESADQPWVTTPPSNQICKTVVVPTIDTYTSFSAHNTVFSCQEDYVITHYTGTITWPRSEAVLLCTSQDDGARLKIGGVVVIYDWYLQAATYCNGYGIYAFTANKPVSIDLWFYENEGAEDVVLKYLSGGDMIVVPEARFTTRFTADGGSCDRSSRSRERCRPTR